MKKLLVAFCFSLFIFSALNAQILEPVKWATSVTKISDSEYELQSTATIDGDWHLYSQTVTENGPVPTTFVYEGDTNYLKKGNTKEEEGHTIEDPFFKMQIKYFDKRATFKQRIKLKTNNPLTIKGVVEFMVCNDTQCLSPKEVDLVFEIK